MTSVSTALGVCAHTRSLEVLYQDHHAWLCSWLRRKLANPADAADLAQDTFVRLLGKPPQQARALREPRAWLTTAAHGLWVDHVRRQALERAYAETLAQAPPTLHPSPEERLLLLETLARIDALLDGLAPKARMAFLLSRLEGLSYPQIAAKLGVCLSSVEKYMAVALRHGLALRERLAVEA
ncbi:MAG TPA: sigma-70 family RNA polymerase sigma factor [Methylibium sp.]|nr:sigma-70 family RNA polymerase sigma factor [Methylibium sp.]